MQRNKHIYIKINRKKQRNALNFGGDSTKVKVKELM
jgi:hypothetical protein